MRVRSTPPRPFVVHRVRRETADTVTLELIAAGLRTGACAFRGRPVHHAVLASAIGEVPISISGNPNRPDSSGPHRSSRRRRDAGHLLRPSAAISSACADPFGQGLAARARARGSGCRRSSLAVSGWRRCGPSLYHLLAHRSRYRAVSASSTVPARPATSSTGGSSRAGADRQIDRQRHRRPRWGWLDRARRCGHVACSPAQRLDPVGPSRSSAAPR
ncbi:MAG: hypothetical protein KatS3mg059_1110 [Thermomicrobiales bacterium]|nr:MAG: hypothetical protein KatS3mg059_1110 [Thermomicrobiales bacterium]